MKLSTFIVLYPGRMCAVGLAGQAVADVNSLRGAEAVPATPQAPELMKFINDKENIDRTFEEQPPLVPHDEREIHDQPTAEQVPGLPYEAGRQGRGQVGRDE